MKISVITATMNSEKTILGCISSVASQSFVNTEHIIVDGLSTDSTMQIVKNFKGRDVQIISENDCGIYDALNKGISKSTGDVVCFLHSDDLYPHSFVLERVAASFSSNPNLCAVYGDLEYVSKNNVSRVIRKWRSEAFSRSRLERGWMPPHPTLFVKKEHYKDMGGFDISYKISADYLSILKFFTSDDFVTEYIPQVLVTMRLGGVSNRSLSSIIMKTKEDWRAIKYLNLRWDKAVCLLLNKNLSKIRQFSFPRW